MEVFAINAAVIIESRLDDVALVDEETACRGGINFLHYAEVGAMLFDVTFCTVRICLHYFFASCLAEGAAHFAAVVHPSLVHKERELVVVGSETDVVGHHRVVFPDFDAFGALVAYWQFYAIVDTVVVYLQVCYVATYCKYCNY